MNIKRIFLLALILGLMLTMTSVASAKFGRGNPKGEVKEIHEGYIIILTDEDGELTIYLPEGFDYETISIDMYVVAKGTWVESGFEAYWVKEEDPEGEPDEREGEGHAWGRGGIYCAGGKTKQHPMAARIGVLYEVDPEWVMGEFCSGHGFGTIMLALQTKGLTGEGAEDLLNTHKAGKGWGVIWKNVGLFRHNRAGNPPPGWLKKFGH
jgi:hypothetical protein